MALKDTLLRIFTWWNGQTMSLALLTARRGAASSSGRTISATSDAVTVPARSGQSGRTHDLANK